MSMPRKFLYLPLSAMLVISGCASQSALESLKSDVDSLSAQVEQARTESAEALRLSQGMQQSLEEVKRSSDSASSDASATRTLLEQMNTRLDTLMGSQSLK